MNTSNTRYSAIVQLLDQEYALLRTLDATGLQRLAERKAEILGAMENAHLSLPEIREISALALRNQCRLSAVAKGIAAAISLVKALDTKDVPVMHYARDGQRSEMQHSTSKFNRRA